MPEFECHIENDLRSCGVDHRFLLAYCECIAFTEQVPIGSSVRFSEGAMTSIIHDCKEFLEIIEEAIGLAPSDYSKAGHDFWFTRNHHGAGFWDGDWGDDGRELTDLAHQFSECYIWPSWEDGTEVSQHESGEWDYDEREDETIILN